MAAAAAAAAVCGGLLGGAVGLFLFLFSDWFDPIAVLVHDRGFCFLMMCMPEY
ncbi:hypothetical protein OH807_03950 [Kitasatospora sp. NBC_01560]|uniref:hypothetical protein n=1 Tax=Kitasatospora sp. NBC_01560 TaxID=2975965 RepID=UPI00386415B5